MRNALDVSCRENQSIHFMFSNFFFENFIFYEIVSKNSVESKGPKWRHSTAHMSCMLDKQGYMHVAHAHAHAPEHTHVCKRACTHGYVIFVIFPREQWFAQAPYCYVIRTLPVLFKCLYQHQVINFDRAYRTGYVKEMFVWNGYTCIKSRLYTFVLTWNMLSREGCEVHDK
jgi:hypothetical protein